MAGTARDGRSTYAYRQLVDQVRSLGLPCWICGWPIDYSITGADNRRHRDGFTLDHVLPVSQHPDLLLDPANARAAHRKCNSMKGARTLQTVPGQSRRW